MNPITWIDYIDKAPPLLLLFFFTIAFGYVLRRSEWIPNKRIPLLLFFFGAIVYPLMRYGLTPFLVKGALISGGGWLFHKVILNRLEERYPWLKKALAGENGFETEFVVKQTIKTDTAPIVAVNITDKTTDPEKGK